ncbi:MAG: YihY family inner membrane protein [Alphaproteobacteria bacterium]
MATPPIIARAAGHIRQPRRSAGSALSFLRYAAGRFFGDGGLATAASLAYTSLLAIVPLFAIGLSVMAAFPVFGRVRSRFATEVLDVLVPSSSADIVQHLDAFVANTGKLTAIGVVWLAVTAIMLLSTIENAFNAIWRVKGGRPLAQRLVSYWTVLTLGPLLLGTALSIGPVLFAMAHTAGEGVGLGGVGRAVALTISPLLTAAGLAVLYMALPHRPVRWTWAALGGIVGAVLFELLKRGFGLYVENAGSYESVYGSLAALPIFLIWMYLAWSVVLFGAATAASLPEWLAQRRAMDDQGPLTGDRILLRALQAIEALLLAGRDGRRVNDDEIIATADGDARGVGAALGALIAAGWIARTDTEQPVLARDFEGVTLFDLYRVLGLGLESVAIADIADRAWDDRLRDALGQLLAADRAALSVPVKTLLGIGGATS